MVSIEKLLFFIKTHTKHAKEIVLKPFIKSRNTVKLNKKKKYRTTIDRPDA